MEKRIQNRLFDILFDIKANGKNKFYCITPNVKFFDWESDLIFKDRNDMLYEFEIKTSKSDFLADFKKPKHKMMKSASMDVANYFYFVCPDGIVNVSDVPEYAGLYLYRSIGDNIDIFVAKAAPLLHDKGFGFKASMRLYSSIYFKYWRMRSGMSTRLK